ncbi:MAG: hypothetical protein ABL951_12225 [Alphaproteobacteria bacterium]
MGIRATLLSSALLLAVPGIANAIPNQHLNPHSDDPADISWQQIPAAVPDTTNHLHIEDVNITVLPNVGFAHNRGAGQDNQDWLSTRVWDDRFYRFADNAGANALWDRFGHGYVDPAFRPRYTYAADVTEAARPLVDEAMSTWNERAKDEGEETRTTPAGNDLKTSVIFERVVAGARELLVDFMEGFQEISNAVGEWIFSPSLVDPDFPAADTPTPLTLMFETSPTTTFGVTRRDEDGDGDIDVDDGVWELSTDGLALDDVNKAFGDVSDDFDIGWSFDKTPDVLFDDRDFDYRAPDGTVYEGNEAAFAALGITLFDTWGGFPNFAAETVIDIYESDFFSVALHEWGHVIGFRHSNGGIMDAAAPFTMNHVTQTIDDRSAFGAAAMYSIPVTRNRTIPAPDSLIMFGSGLAGLLLLKFTPGFFRLSRQ